MHVRGTSDLVRAYASVHSVCIFVRAYMHPVDDVARVARVRAGRRAKDVHSARPTLSSRARRQRAISTSMFYTNQPTTSIGRGSLWITVGNVQAESEHAIQCVAQLQAC